MSRRVLDLANRQSARTVPHLHAVPLFTALTARADLYHCDVRTYGVLAAYELLGHAPSIAEIAATCRDRQKQQKPTRARLRKLEQLGLIRRELVPGKRTRFVLLGPHYDALRPSK